MNKKLKPFQNISFKSLTIFLLFSLIGCQNISFLLPEYIRLDLANDGTPCPGNCTTCKDSNSCDVCQQGFFKSSKSRCIECPFDSSYQSYCQECLENSNWAPKPLEKCSFLLSQSTIVSAINYRLLTPQTTENNIELCSYDCLECTSKNTCIKCPSNYYLSINDKNEQVCRICPSSNRCSIYNKTSLTPFSNGSIIDPEKFVEPLISQLIIMECQPNFTYNYQFVLTPNYTCTLKMGTVSSFLDYFYASPILERIDNEESVLKYLTNQTEYLVNLENQGYNYLVSQCPIRYAISQDFSVCVQCQEGCSQCYYSYTSNDGETVNYTDIQIKCLSDKTHMNPSLLTVDVNLTCIRCDEGYYLAENRLTCEPCSNIHANCSICGYGTIDQNSQEIIPSENVENSQLYCFNCTEGYGVVKLDNNQKKFQICKQCEVYCQICRYLTETQQFCFKCANNNSTFTGSILDFNQGLCYFGSLPFIDSQGVKYNATELPYYEQVFPQNQMDFYIVQVNKELCYRYARFSVEGFSKRFLFCMQCSNSYFQSLYENIPSFPVLNSELFSGYCVPYYANNEYYKFARVYVGFNGENITNYLVSPWLFYRLYALFMSNNTSFYEKEDQFVLYEKSYCYYPNLQLIDNSKSCVQGISLCLPEFCFYKDNTNNSAFLKCDSCAPFSYLDNSVFNVYNSINEISSNNLIKKTYFDQIMDDVVSYLKSNIQTSETFEYDDEFSSTKCYKCKTGCFNCDYSQAKEIYARSTLYSSPDCTRCFNNSQKVKNYVYDERLKTCRYCPNEWQLCKAYINRTIYINCSANMEIFNEQNATITSLNSIASIFAFLTYNPSYYFLNELVVEELNLTFILQSECSLNNNSLEIEGSYLQNIYYLKSLNLKFMGETGSEAIFLGDKYLEINGFTSVEIANLILNSSVESNKFYLEIYTFENVYIKNLKIISTNGSNFLTSEKPVFSFSNINSNLEMTNIYFQGIAHNHYNSFISMSNIRNIICVNIVFQENNFSHDYLFYLISISQSIELFSITLSKISLYQNNISNGLILYFDSPFTISSTSKPILNLTNWDISNNTLQIVNLYKNSKYSNFINFTNLVIYNNTIGSKTEDYFIYGYNLVFKDFVISQNNFSYMSLIWNYLLIGENGLSNPFINPYNVMDGGNIYNNTISLYSSQISIITFLNSIQSTIITNFQKFYFKSIIAINNTFNHDSNSIYFFYFPNQCISFLCFLNISLINSKQMSWFFIEETARVFLLNVTIEGKPIDLINDEIRPIQAIYLSNFLYLTMNTVKIKYFFSEDSIVELYVANSVVEGSISIENSLFQTNYLQAKGYAIISTIKISLVSLTSVLISSSSFESNFLDTDDYSYMESTSCLYILNNQIAECVIQSSSFSSNSPNNIAISYSSIRFENNRFSNSQYFIPSFFNNNYTQDNILQMLSSSQAAFSYLITFSMNMIGCVFDGSTNNNVGGILFDSLTQKYLSLELLTNTFINLQTKSDGGAFFFYLPKNYITGSHQFLIENSSFINIFSSNRGSCFFFDNSDGNINFTMSDCNFSNTFSISEGSIMHLEKGVSITINLKNLVIDKKEESWNNPESVGNFFHLAFNDNYVCKLTIEKINVFDIVCDCSLIYFISYRFKLSESNIENNTFGGDGIIYLSDLSEECVIMNTNFTRNKINSTENEITSPLSPFWSFNYLKLSILSLLNLRNTINITRNIFKQNECISCLGGSIYFYATQIYVKLIIESTNFLENKAIVGGAAFIYVLGTLTHFSGYNEIFISNSSFIENMATYFGGSMYIYNGYTNITNVFFQNNYVNGTKKKIYFDENQTNYIDYSYNFIQNKGGALFYEGYSTTNAISYLNISICNFENNSAGIGGALYYYENKIQLSQNVFDSNKADFYGNNIYRYPKKICLIRNSETNMSQKIENETNTSNYTFEAGSGQVIEELVFQFFDEDNNSIDIFEESINVLIYISMIPTNNSSTSSSSDKYGIKGTTTAYQNITKGTFHFNSLTFIGNRDETYRIVVNSTIFNSENNSFVFYIKFRECFLGEIYDSTTNVCDACPEGLYSLEKDAQSCKACQNSMSFCQQNVTIIRASFWRRNNLTDEIEECKINKNLCLGDEKTTNYNGDLRCPIGHIGALCSSCDVYGKFWGEKWAKKNKYSCGKCSDLQFNLSILILLLIVNVVSIGLSVKGMVSMTDTEVETKAFRKLGFFFLHNKQKKTSIYLKIFMTYFQIVSCLTSFDLTLPPEINVFPDTVGNPTEALLYSTDCFIVDMFKEPPFIYVKAIVTIIMPLIYLLLFILTYYILVAAKVFSNRPKVFYTAAFFVLIYMQPNIVSILISILSCQTVANMDYIKADLGYECYTSEHIFYSLIFSLPALLLWAVFMPLLIFWNLFKARNKLHCIDVRLKYGFLYSEYKVKIFFWEFIKMIEKICIIVFLSFFEADKKLKGMLILIAIFLYLVLLVYIKPYKTEELNKIDIASSIICFLTIFFAILAYNNPFDAFMYISYSVIFITNGIFIYVLGKKLLISILETENELFDKFKKRLKDTCPKCFFWLKTKKEYKTLGLWHTARRAVLRYLNAKYRRALKAKTFFKKRTSLDKSTLRKIKKGVFNENYDPQSPERNPFNINSKKASYIGSPECLSLKENDEEIVVKASSKPNI